MPEILHVQVLKLVIEKKVPNAVQYFCALIIYL